MNSSIIDMMWQTLQDEIQQVKERAAVQTARFERAETTGGVIDSLFGSLPYNASGATDGDLVLVSNACKAGEAAGSGTGALCYFDSFTDTWKRVADDAAPLSAGSTGGGPSPSATVVTETSFGQASTAGVAAAYSRGDHTHGTPAAPSVPAFASPTIALGSAAATGVAGTVIRSDATIAAFDATNPAASAPGDTVVVGTAAFAARRDHRHAREAYGAAGDIGAETFGASAAAGAVGKVADAGHVHALPLIAYTPGGRLTLTSGTPVTTADVTAATTLYYTPYVHNQIMLYTGSVWEVKTFAELSIAIPATTNQMYDVFVYDNAGTVTLELLAWTNDTTRATALAYQDGRLVKSGAATRLYLGSMRTGGTSGKTDVSLLYGGVWNYYQRCRRKLQVYDATGHTYVTNSWRNWNNNAALRVGFIIGLVEESLLTIVQGSGNSFWGIGTALNGTAPNVGIGNGSANTVYVAGTLNAYPALGYNYAQAVEAGTGAAGTFGDILSAIDMPA